MRLGLECLENVMVEANSFCEEMEMTPIQKEKLVNLIKSLCIYIINTSTVCANAVSETRHIVNNIK